MVKSYPPPFRLINLLTLIFHGLSMNHPIILYHQLSREKPSDSTYWRYISIYIPHKPLLSPLCFFLIYIYIMIIIIYVLVFSGSITISHWPENSWNESRPWWFPNPIPIIPVTEFMTWGYYHPSRDCISLNPTDRGLTIVSIVKSSM